MFLQTDQPHHLSEVCMKHGTGYIRKIISDKNSRAVQEKTLLYGPAVLFSFLSADLIVSDKLIRKNHFTHRADISGKRNIPIFINVNLQFPSGHMNTDI